MKSDNLIFQRITYNAFCSKHLIFFAFFILFPAVVFSQHGKTAETDSIRLKKYYKVLYRDTAMVVAHDTVVPRDTAIVKVKKRWPVRFYNNYIVAQKDEAKIDTFERASYEGKIVGNIRIMRLEPFGTSIQDTSQVIEDWFIKAGNTIHINTQKRVILNNLTFENGDKLGAYTLADAERVLRNTSYILDARIYGIPRNGNQDTIDIVVVEKDVFSIDISINLPDIDELELELNELNMLGLGHQFYNKFQFFTYQRPGYIGKYEVENLAGSFMTMWLEYGNTPDSQFTGFNSFREFITPETQNAGGLLYQYMSKYEKIDTLDNGEFEDDLVYKLGYNELDGWYGRAFLLNTKRKNYKERTNFVLTARTVGDKFFERPVVTADTNLFYQDKILLLGSIGLSQRNYYKDYFLFGFGRTEDVPIGRKIELISGYEFGEIVNRYYGAVNLSQGRSFKRAGYFNTTFQFGGYLNDKKIEQGAVKVFGRYFSKLFGREKSFKQRFLLGLNYARSINYETYTGIKFLDLGGGQRGVGSEELSGNKAINLGSGYQIYSPWSLIGFRIAFFNSVDLVYLNDDEDGYVFSGRPYWGIGTGIRMNNENLILGTIEMRFSFYPAPPEGTSVFGVGLAVNPSLNLPDFNISKPKQVGLNTVRY